MSERPIGLALGGGAALGYAHVPVLAALEDLGLRPAVIAGTSIGAILGAMAAAGQSSAEIRDHLRDLRYRGGLPGRFWRSRPRVLETLVGRNWRSAFQLDPEQVLAAFADHLPRAFSDLAIPLRVVAADYQGGAPAVLQAGPLRPAIAASMALPVMFRPVPIGDRLYLDGGLADPVPFDEARVPGGIVIAIDLVANPARRPRLPGPVEAAVAATQLMMRRISDLRLAGLQPPDILVRPPVQSFHPLAFGKVDAILAAAEPVREELKQKLAAVLG